jgi:hypothetical protein
MMKYEIDFWDLIHTSSFLLQPLISEGNLDATKHFDRPDSVPSLAGKRSKMSLIRRQTIKKALCKQSFLLLYGADIRI